MIRKPPWEEVSQIIAPWRQSALEGTPNRILVAYFLKKSVYWGRRGGGLWKDGVRNKFSRFSHEYILHINFPRPSPPSPHSLLHPIPTLIPLPKNLKSCAFSGMFSRPRSLSSNLKRRLCYISLILRAIYYTED